ncbi:MAG: hypothetical protein U0132_22450 [Gemmatimonadaceae bacterium]
MVEPGPSAATAVRANEQSAERLAELRITRFAAPRATPRDEVPWQLVEKNGAIELHVVRLMEESLADPLNAAILLACGGVLENLRLAVNGAGFVGDITFFPDPANDDLLATLRIGEAREAGHEEHALFSVLERSLQSGPLGVAPSVSELSGAGRLAPAQLAVFHHAARSRGCWIDLITDDVRRSMLAEMVARATTLTDAAMGSRPLFSLFTSEPLGALPLIERDPFGLDHLFSLLGANVRTGPPRHRMQKVWPGGAVVEAPLLAILGSADDTPKDWMFAGAAIQRVLLHATIQNLAATFFAEPLRHPLVRDQLRLMLFAAGQPHAVMRFEEAVPIAPPA